MQEFFEEKRRKKGVKIGRRIICLVLPALYLITSVAAAGKVIPVGRAAGIKMFSHGVMLTKLSAVETEKGIVWPAKQAGLLEGDVLLSIGGEGISSNEQLQQLIAKSGGNAVKVKAERSGKAITASVTPVQSKKDGTYKIGVLVRDSMAGIGTITFVDPETGVFASLGHGVCDVDTGLLLPLESGSVMEASVAGVKKGESGAPGELHGEFNLKKDMGQLSKNTDAGVYGVLSEDGYYRNLQAIPVADRSEIRTGAAQILSNVEGEEARLYDIEITKLYPDGDDMGRSMSIKVTDPVLLAKTGGIVQGMSGSPVIQNGRLIGAVTHVLVNDPQKGYAIFIEKMLAEADCASAEKAA